jgi:UDP-N-acetylmuramoylalanine--D-glutamate ligase
MTHRFIVLGGGEAGTGAAILAKKQGYDVFLSDAGELKKIYRDELETHGIAYEEKKVTEEKILQANEVMKSPGIPESNALVQKIRKAGIPIISDIELAWRFKGDSQIVAISGSNGKTTTTSLLYHICRHAGIDCALVGNIGYSVARQVAVDPKPLYITEISSFQLDDIHSFYPHIAILTNITEDHLDRYEYKFENYIKSKFNLVKNQTATDYFIYCADDPVTVKYLSFFSYYSNPLPFTMNQEPQKGAFIKDGKMTIALNDDPLTMSVDDFKIKGKHNQYNTMAAGIAAATLGIRKEKIREAVVSFENLEHRMESVGTVKGVEYINDSKATNVNSTWFALESMTKPTVLILGGVDKGNDYDILKELVQDKVKAIICMGTDNKKILEAFKGIVPAIFETNSAKDAVNSAYRIAQKGDIVLLSPACASFDLFKNYEDRGKQFKEAVREL